MSIGREMIMALGGAWRLAHFDPRGLLHFELSAAGARRSFLAALFVLPLYAMSLYVRYPEEDPGGPLGRFLLAEAVAYVVSWTLYPVIVEALSARLGCQHRFPAYLTAYNWSMVIQNMIFVPLTVLVALGALPMELGQVLWLAAMVFTIAYVLFIARITLAVPAFTAAGLVILDIALSFALGAITASLY